MKSKEEIELAIRDEVERRFGNPPKAFVDLIESEVQKRIRRQEWYYWLILATFVLFATISGIVFWHSQLADIPNAIQKQLADAGTISAQREIQSILSYSRDASNSVSIDWKNFHESTTSTSEAVRSNYLEFIDKYNDFTNRTSGFERQKYVVLVEDVLNLFTPRNEFVTNMAALNTNRIITLSYEPIPQTLKIYYGEHHWLFADINTLGAGVGYLEGKEIIFTNKAIDFSPTGPFKYLEVEYIKKPIH